MMLGGNGALRAVCAAAAVSAIALTAGCGGDEENNDAAAQKVDYQVANEPADVFVKRLARLLATTTAKKDCADLYEIAARSFSRFSCPSPRELRRSMRRFEVVGAAEYGTGAVVDYESGKVDDGATILLFVAPNRKWGVSRFGVLTEPSTETDDEETREGFDTTVSDYLAAVRERDCAAYADLALTSTKEERTVCKLEFPSTAKLARRLKADPTARPRYQGGNAAYGFYTLETKRPQPENVTISVAKATTDAARPYVVLDVAPSPTAAVQRQIFEEFKRQQRNPEPETSKSRKAG